MPVLASSPLSSSSIAFKRPNTDAARKSPPTTALFENEEWGFGGRGGAYRDRSPGESGRDVLHSLRKLSFSLDKTAFATSLKINGISAEVNSDFANKRESPLSRIGKREPFSRSESGSFYALLHKPEMRLLIKRMAFPGCRGENAALMERY